jgi:hypothetical protein
MTSHDGLVTSLLSLIFASLLPLTQLREKTVSALAFNACTSCSLHSREQRFNWPTSPCQEGVLHNSGFPMGNFSWLTHSVRWSSSLVLVIIFLSKQVSLSAVLTYRIMLMSRTPNKYELVPFLFALARLSLFLSLLLVLTNYRSRVERWESTLSRERAERGAMRCGAQAGLQTNGDKQKHSVDMLY